MEDRDRTVSRRSKPSSRNALIGEQPNPWDLVQPQDALSRHRGAKPPRRCELSVAISLLSRGTFYPLSHGPSLGTAGSLSPTFVPARPVRPAVKLPCAFALDARLPTALREPLGASVTFWEATTPVKLPTRHCPRSGSRTRVRVPTKRGRYFNVDST